MTLAVRSGPLTTSRVKDVTLTQLAVMPSPPGPPMTLGNMRSLGVRSLFVTCVLCRHEAVLSAERWGDAMLVREFRPRMVCTRCGMVGADARPNWRAFTVQGK
jgi:hypothetical protein